MSQVLRIAIVDPADATREMLRNSLLGVETCWLEAECSRYEFFADVIKQSTPNVVFVTLDADPDQAIRLIQSISTAHPEVDVVAASSRNDSYFILQAFRGGAKEFLALPVQYEEILSALDRIRSARFGKGGESGGGGSKLYAFIGARGGSGCTSLAVNFAANLAADQKGSGTALVDLDLALGDADVCLDVVPEYTLYDVAQSIDRIDLQFLKKSLTKHSSGLYLLPHPVEIQQAHVVQPEHVHRVLSLMKMSFQHLVVDCSKSYLGTDFAALHMADEILMVTQLDLTSIRNVVRIMMCFAEQPELRKKVKILANRVGSSDAEIPPQKAEETIGQPLLCRIPNDSKSMMVARNSGQPVREAAPRTKLHQSLVEFTDLVIGRSGDTPKAPAKKGFFFFGGGN